MSEPRRKSRASHTKMLSAEQEQPKRRDLSENERKELRKILDHKRDRPRAPKARVKSAPRKPLHLDFPLAIELSRFMSAFGRAETAFAHLMLYGILNAACEGGPENPPSERDIDRVLVAVTGIGARDEIEGMLARDADGGDAFRGDERFAAAKGPGDGPSTGQQWKPISQATAHLRGADSGARFAGTASIIEYACDAFIRHHVLCG